MSEEQKWLLLSAVERSDCRGMWDVFLVIVTDGDSLASECLLIDGT